MVPKLLALLNVAGGVWLAASVHDATALVILAGALAGALMAVWALGARVGNVMARHLLQRLEVKFDQFRSEMRPEITELKERLSSVEGALGVIAEAEKHGVRSLVERGTAPGRRADDIIR